MRKPATRWQSVLAVVTILLILAVALTNVLASGYERSLFDLTHEGTVQGLGDLLSDVDRLKVALARHRLGNGEKPSTQLVTRFDDLRARLKALKQASSDRMTAVPSGLAALLAIDSAIETLGPIVVAPDIPGNELAIQDNVRLLEASIGVIASVAATDLYSDIEREDAGFKLAYATHLWLSTLLVIFGLCMFVVFLRTNRRLHDFARRDPLTGLQNRITFAETLSHLVENPGPGNDVALMLIDIDHFKAINDTLGHSAGDALLKELARRFGDLGTHNAYISRLGGDEFAILLVGRSVYHEARNMAEALGKASRVPFEIEEKKISVSLSIGIAYTPSGWYYREILLKQADVALYAAKHAGRDTFRFYDPKMGHALRAKGSLEDDLRRAIDNDQLQLRFQPIVCMK